MSLAERKVKRKIDCYTITEIYDFFAQFYVDINTEWNTHIIRHETYHLSNSDITIEVKSYGDDNLVQDILIITWAGGWGHNQKSLHLEYRPKENDVYEWFIVDRYIGYYKEIEKKDILTLLVDFIFENDLERYEKPLMLRRNLILDGLI